MEENNEILEYNCTNCGTRVSREDKKCPACWVELEGFEDVDDDVIVEIKTYTNELYAQIDKSMLEAEGIECFLNPESNLVPYGPYLITLNVLKKDMKSALEILNSSV
jgi:hypothetical protein